MLALRILLMAVACLAVASGSMGATQAASGANTVTRLDLGFDMATAGGQVSMPILLEAAEGVQVGKTVNEIAFPKKILAFEKATTDVAGGKIETEVRADAKNPDISIVKVTLTSPDKAIPVGIVASLVFRVAKDARAKEPIKLGNVPRAFTAGKEPRPIDPIEGRDGEIKLGPPPVIACFFYMH